MAINEVKDFLKGLAEQFKFSLNAVNFYPMAEDLELFF